MLKSARHTRIRNLVEDKGHVAVNELNAILEVSEATVRRDLDELAQLGWVRRTHGGAVKVGRAGKEPPIFQRQNELLEEKQRIGRMAASLVRDGQTIFLGSGTTVHEIARNIGHVKRLTVITNAINVINEFMDSRDVELVVIGGLFRQSELSMVGHIAEYAIREFRADYVFMGMRGIDPTHGFTNDFIPEATIDRAVLQMAPNCVVVADHTKLGQVSTVHLAPVTVASIIITDSQAPAEIILELEELGLTVYQV